MTNPQEFNGGVPGGNYDAEQAPNGTWTIKALPIFSEVESGKRGNQKHIGPEWMNAAIAKAKELRFVQQHMAPVHLGHHGALKNKETPRVGFLKPDHIGRLTIEGKHQWVLFADVVGISQENMGSLKNLSHPYRSVEIGDWNKPEIASLALLSDESPYFKFPMLTIGQMKAHAGKQPIKFGAERDGNHHFFEFTYDETVGRFENRAKDAHRELVEADKKHRFLPVGKQHDDERASLASQVKSLHKKKHDATKTFRFVKDTVPRTPRRIKIGGRTLSEFSAVPIWLRKFSETPVWMGECPHLFQSQPSDQAIRHSQHIHMMKSLARANKVSNTMPAGRIDGQGFQAFRETNMANKDNGPYPGRRKETRSWDGYFDDSQGDGPQWTTRGGNYRTQPVQHSDEDDKEFGVINTVATILGGRKNRQTGKRDWGRHNLAHGLKTQLTSRTRNPEEYHEVKPRGATDDQWRDIQKKSGYKNQYERIAKTPGQSHKDSPFKTHPLHGGLAGLATGVAHHVLGLGKNKGQETSSGSNRKKPNFPATKKEKEQQSKKKPELIFDMDEKRDDENHPKHKETLKEFFATGGSPALQAGQAKRILSSRSQMGLLSLNKNGQASNKLNMNPEKSALRRRENRGIARPATRQGFMEFFKEKTKAKWLVQPPGVGWY